ncbi:hypothetical protein HNR42_002592 [Deinobacterium chartae]|uniref:FAD-binding PCMH-type domain-containing protein n=1 Tax=Deinobacterium chartae TaxID=521158 RepID=A0A841I267_9DEIO|nr:FAD-binding oxidoreductase [Deinobacterium chartae]MBB6099156.1 hypothetical protein [Deinobacterium chartae]
MSEQTLTLTPEVLSVFEASLEGRVILPESEVYEDARGIWNAAIDRRPALIVCAASARDVAHAVTFARQQGLQIAVRSGGHSPVGFSVCEGGMVIDLSGLRNIEIDPFTRRARIEPGLTWLEVAAAAHPHGLAITSGDVGSVGVGGLLTGGGIGWMVRKEGLTIDQLEAVEMVLASGEIVRASRTEHPDLFWAVRGGGGNFGIVTAFELRMHDGGNILGGVVFFDASQGGAEMLEAYVRHAESAPDGLTTQAVLMAIPPLPFVPQEYHFKPGLAILVCFSGDLEEGERALAPLRTLGTPLADLIGPMPYPAIFALTEEGSARGMRHHTWNGFLNTFDGEVARNLVDAALEVAHPGMMVQLRVLGGQMARVSETETAFPFRNRPYLLMVSNSGPDATTDALRAGATERLWSSVQAQTSGAYLNFLGLGDRLDPAWHYPEATLQRLAAVKGQYDPENVFRNNLNIAPKRNVPELI